MIDKIRTIFSKTKDVSVVKRFFDNPDKFRLTMEAEGNKIIISIEEKESKNESRNI